MGAEETRFPWRARAAQSSTKTRDSPVHWLLPIVSVTVSAVVAVATAIATASLSEPENVRAKMFDKQMSACSDWLNLQHRLDIAILNYGAAAYDKKALRPNNRDLEKEKRALFTEIDSDRGSINNIWLFFLRKTSDDAQRASVDLHDLEVDIDISAIDRADIFYHRAMIVEGEDAAASSDCISDIKRSATSPTFEIFFYKT